LSFVVVVAAAINYQKQQQQRHIHVNVSSPERRRSPPTAAAKIIPCCCFLVPERYLYVLYVPLLQLCRNTNKPKWSDKSFVKIANHDDATTERRLFLYKTNNSGGGLPPKKHFPIDFFSILTKFQERQKEEAILHEKRTKTKK
jgi:hypothetical protein